MMTSRYFFLTLIVGLLLLGCKKGDDMKVSKDTVKAGTGVTMKGQPVDLYEGHLEMSENLLASLESDLAEKLRGKVAIISVVPSLETKVCDAQTHKLGEAKKLDPEVLRLTISRDLPMAQERFAKEAHLENITYYSDYKFGTFGRRHGLMMKDKELLARAVIVVDKHGVVKHVQIVPEISELPDMDAAIQVANQLVKH